MMLGPIALLTDLVKKIKLSSLEDANLPTIF